MPSLLPIVSGSLSASSVIPPYNAPNALFLSLTSSLLSFFFFRSLFLYEARESRESFTGGAG
ncbi:hypothetical protein BDV26DRAFT_259414 [Aspergillus bertholletiae]|uniref:Uncharacterized protein n=1 Tax=Aspergillus bertholletiae TaxID=1226010 RepID=A0A5N7BCN9_9EURO|nr:hypothetical protein BDV26DRAFT_259414 [Aspergillus bertholletiae]